LTKALSQDKLDSYSDKSIGIGIEEKNLSGTAAERKPFAARFLLKNERGPPLSPAVMNSGVSRR